jgi:hypothetical protein
VEGSGCRGLSLFGPRRYRSDIGATSQGSPSPSLPLGPWLRVESWRVLVRVEGVGESIGCPLLDFGARGVIREGPGR